jgi:hypothetical protein
MMLCTRYAERDVFFRENDRNIIVPGYTFMKMLWLAT